MTLADALPTVNATLNAVSATLIVLGFRAIKRGERARHRAFMLAAVTCSAVFLVGYLTRVALTGTHRFPVEGGAKVVYLAVLASHTVLAALAAPMILRSLFLALKDRLPDHRRIARLTFPVWLYVSVTGVVVYAMLYHLAPALR